MGGMGIKKMVCISNVCTRTHENNDGDIMTMASYLYTYIRTTINIGVEGRIVVSN